MRHISPKNRKEVSLPLDSRNRICLTQFISKNLSVTSYRAYQEGEKIILEPMAEVPAWEAWLYNSPKALASVLEGIEQADKGQLSKLDLDLSQFEEEDGI